MLKKKRNKINHANRIVILYTLETDKIIIIPTYIISFEVSIYQYALAPSHSDNRLSTFNDDNTGDLLTGV